MIDHTAPEALPTAAWALGWSFLAGQVFQLLLFGVQDVGVVPLSMLLGVVLVAFFSYGVLRARMVRTVLVGVGLTLGVLGMVAALPSGGGTAFVSLVVSGIQLACFIWFVRTPWFAWQRARPDGGPSIAPLLMIAVAVGLLGGVVGADPSGFRIDIGL